MTMGAVGEAVVPAPIPGGTDFHLFVADSSAGPASYVYLPVCPAPGLATDILRLDVMPSAPLSLDQIATRWLTQYQQWAEGRAEGELVQASDDEFLLHAGFSHPIVGHQHCALRYVRVDGRDYGYQFIRKLDPLPAPDIAARLAFLAGCEPSAPAPLSPAYTAYAAAAQAKSAEIELLFRHPPARVGESDLEALCTLLEAASPFHHPLPWAMLARIVAGSARQALLVRAFEPAQAYLRRAVLTFSDGRGDPQLAEAMYQTAAELADIRLLTPSPQRPSMLTNACELYAAIAVRQHDRRSELAQRCAVMADLAATLRDRRTLDHPRPSASVRRTVAGPGGAATSDGLDQAMVAAERTLAAAAELLSVAASSDPSLYLDACTAADQIQWALERAVATGATVSSAQWNGVVADLIRAFDIQIESQRRYYNLDRALVGQRPRVGAASRPASRSLVYLRPLASTRGLTVGNSFGSYYASLITRLGPLPDNLSLEAALHIALMEQFATQALGGPVDVFGMARSTALFGDEPGLRTWQRAASMMIATADILVVVHSDTTGLQWELAEIERQGARAKVVVAAIPGEVTTPVDDPLPADAPRHVLTTGDGGFLLQGATPDVDVVLAFSALWDGALLRALVAKVPTGAASVS